MRTTTGLTRWGLTAAIVTLILGLFAWRWSAGGIFSPGQLGAGASDTVSIGGVASHAALSRRCSACHPAPWSRETMSDRCRACHVEIVRELKDSSALHGSLGDSGSCLTCHTDHRGSAASLTRFQGKGAAHDRFGFSLAAHRRTASGGPFTCGDCHKGSSFRFDAALCLGCHRQINPGFATAHVHEWGEGCRDCHDGVDRFGRNRFPHDSTRFALAGAHSRTGCAECHTGTRTLAEFGTVGTTCVACHRNRDVHRGEMGTDCAACHDADSWKGARFDHRFPLNHGERGTVPCRTCHEQAPASYRNYTCYGCHEHTPEGILREHREEGVANLSDCVRCHRNGGEGEHEGREHEGREHEGGHED